MNSKQRKLEIISTNRDLKLMLEFQCSHSLSPNHYYSLFPNIPDRHIDDFLLNTFNVVEYISTLDNRVNIDSYVSFIIKNLHDNLLSLENGKTPKYRQFWQ